MQNSNKNGKFRRENDEKWELSEVGSWQVCMKHVRLIHSFIFDKPMKKIFPNISNFNLDFSVRIYSRKTSNFKKFYEIPNKSIKIAIKRKKSPLT